MIFNKQNLLIFALSAMSCSLFSMEPGASDGAGPAGAEAAAAPGIVTGTVVVIRSTGSGTPVAAAVDATAASAVVVPAAAGVSWSPFQPTAMDGVLAGTAGGAAAAPAVIAPARWSVFQSNPVVLALSARLYKAVCAQNYAEAEMFIGFGADVNSVHEGELQRRPIHMAVCLDNRDMVNLLVRYRADVNARSLGNVTPFHVAAFNGDLQMMQLLISLGANMDARLSNGDSILHILTTNNLVTLKNRTDALEWFLDTYQQFDRHCRNNEGETALVLANERFGAKSAATILLLGDEEDQQELVRRPGGWFDLIMVNMSNGQGAVPMESVRRQNVGGAGDHFRSIIAAPKGAASVSPSDASSRSTPSSGGAAAAAAAGVASRGAASVSPSDASPRSTPRSGGAAAAGAGSRLRGSAKPFVPGDGAGAAGT